MPGSMTVNAQLVPQPIHQGGSVPVGNIDHPALPAGGQAAVEHPVQEPQVEQDVGRKDAQELLGKLDVLFSRAATETTVSVDSSSIKKILKSMVGTDKAAQALVKELSDLADRAETSFKRLSSLTGANLANALDAEGNWVDEAGARVQAAIEDQQALSEKLNGLINKYGTGEDGALEEAMFRCDRRVSEIFSLAAEMAEIQAAQNPNEVPPESRARLKMTVERLLPQQALAMHGTAEALAHVKEVLSPLADRLDAFKADGTAGFKEGELAALRQEVAQMRAAVNDMRTNGVEVGNGRVVPDIGLLDGIDNILDGVTKKLSDVRRAVGTKSIMTFAADELKSVAEYNVDSFNLDPKGMKVMQILAPELHDAIVLRRQVAERYAEYVAALKNPNATEAQRLAALASMADAARSLKAMDRTKIRKQIVELTNASRELDGREYEITNNVWLEQYLIEKYGTRALRQRGVGHEGVVEFAQALDLFIIECDNTPRGRTGPATKLFQAVGFDATKLLPKAAHLAVMHKSVGEMKEESFLTGGIALDVFSGKIRPTTLVEARIRGMEDADIDPGLDDANLVEAHKLGSGAANTVYSVSYKNGETYVFKPEAPGRDGMENLVVGDAGAYDDAQQVSQLNIATTKAASALGAEDVMVKTSVGVHNGQYGLFMEKAPGATAADFRRGDKAGADGLSSTEIQALPAQEKQAVKAGLMRGLNRLQWLDIVTGQADRHAGNYLMEVKRNPEGADEKFAVKVTGIDNDACYSSWRTGLYTYEVGPQRYDKFMAALEKFAASLYPDGQARALFIENILNSPAVTHDAEARTVKFDFSKGINDEVAVLARNTFGFQSLQPPRLIDRDMYDHIVALGFDAKGEPTAARTAYLAEIKSRVSEDCYKAAVSRLDDVIAYVKGLPAENIIDKDGWSSPEVQANETQTGTNVQRRGAMKLGSFGPPGAQLYAKGVEDVKMHLARLMRDVYARDLQRHIGN